MISSKIVNSIGLILDSIGALLILLWPEVVKNYRLGDMSEIDPITRERNKKNSQKIFIGVFFLISGFILQIFSNFL